VRGFADLPGHIQRLAADGHARIALVLIDGFGRAFLERHAGHPLLRRLEHEGQIVPVESMFPTTTTAHLTTLYTTLPVGEHGLYEWNVYEPSLDAIITPMLFCYAGDAARDTLLRAGVEPGLLWPSAPTFYERLARDGVASHVFGPATFTPSTVDGVLARGADVHPVIDLTSGLAALGATLHAADGPAYAYFYWDEVDATGHQYGPSSRQFAAAAQRCLDALDAGLRALPEGTIVLLAADHGQVDVDPATTVYVNEAWPEVVGLLARDRRGRPLVPAGSARDLFLHCRPEAIGELVDGLERLLGERATVHRVADVVAAGWLGTVGERLRARLADVCVLPAPRETVWWRERHRFDMRFRGHHGGLTTDEAHTLLASLVVG
jgi:type I phosphodiesterase/nucleotide pyrophosphatase